MRPLGRYKQTTRLAGSTPANPNPQLVVVRRVIDLPNPKRQAQPLRDLKEDRRCC